MTVDEFLNGETDIQPVRQMAYGPVVNEFHHAAMFGPNANRLGATDVAASPDTGFEQGDLIMAPDGTLHTVADWSYLHPNQPTHNTIEFRDRPDQGRGFIKKVSGIDDFLGTAKTAQPQAQPSAAPAKPQSIDDFLGTPKTAAPQPTPQEQSTLADRVKQWIPDTLSTEEEVAAERQFSKEHPYIYGVGKAVSGLVPKSWEEVKRMATLPMPSADVEKNKQESEQWRQAVTGELGPTEQAAGITGTFFQALPLLHLPFAESPLRPTPSELSLQDVLRARQATQPVPPSIIADIKQPEGYVGPGTTAEDVSNARRFTIPEPPEGQVNFTLPPERRFTMVPEPPAVAPVKETLAETIAKMRAPEPRISPETGEQFFPEPEGGPIPQETARFGPEQPTLAEKIQGPTLAQKVARAATPPEPAPPQAGLPSAATVPPSPGERVNPPVDIRTIPEGLPTGEVAETGRERPQETAGVSTQNRYTGGRREVLGMEPAEATVPRSDQSVQDAAETLLRRSPDAGYGLAKELTETPRPIKDVEDAVLRQHIGSLEKQHADLVDHINKTGDVAATEQLHTVRDDLQQAFEAAKKTGTELGRGLRQRQVEDAAQYTLPKMEAERRAVNGGKPLSPAQLKQVETLFKRMQDAQKKVAAAEEAVAKGKAPKARGGLVQYLDKQAEAARQRIIERRGRLNVGFDPTALADEAIIGASHIARGIRNFDAWSSRMLEDFGERVRPYLRQLYERAMQTTKETANSLRKSTKPTGPVAEAIKEFKRQDIYKVRTLKQTEALKQKIAAEDVSSPPSRAALVLDPQAQKFRAEYQKAKYDYQVMLEKDRLANRPALKKIIDTAVDLERAIKLTGIKTFGKLGSAGLARVGQTVAEESVGKAMSLVPGLRRVMQAAPTEGTPTLRSAAAYVRGGLRGIKEIPGVIKGEVTSRDVREGGTPKVPSILDIPGRLHGAVKQPFKKAQESMALQKAIDTAARQGQSLETPGVIEGAQKRAQESGLRAIMTNDNVLSNGWNNFVTALERNKKFPTAGYGAAKVARFLLPIVRVPTNIALEVGTMSTGLVTGTAKLGQVMARGMETLKPEQADMIARHYKKGLVGAGLFLTGYFNADKFAGFYQSPEGKKREQIARHGMKPGQAKFGAMTIPEWLIMHSPAGLMMQFGATVKKYQDTGKSAPASATAGAAEIMHEVPFVNEMARIDDMLKSNWEGERARGQLVKGTVVPQGVQNVAQWLDPYKRAPKTPLEYIQSGVPWWSQGLRKAKYQ